MNHYNFSLKMFKLLRFSNTIVKLCEIHQYCKVRFVKQGSINPVNQLNSILDNKLYLKHYSTQQSEIAANDDSVTKEETTIDKVVANDPASEQKLKVLVLEMEVMRQEGHSIPSDSFMKKSYWIELLKLGTRTARKRYLNYLFKLEKKKENVVLKKEQKRAERESNPPPLPSENSHLIYSLSHNNIFLRFYDTTINHFYNYRLIQAMLFGQPLVVDCSYEKEMTKRENQNCAKQLMLLFGENRIHNARALHKHIATLYEPWFPLNIHQQNYLEIFPKEKLVYLTPDCREEMVEYDHDAIYIIGGIVDKAGHHPLSLAKAKKEGLKMQKLPLDRYLQWGSGSGKSLTLNQMISVLLDVKKTGDWKYALRHVPRRKLVNEENTYVHINRSRTLPYDTDNSEKRLKYNKQKRNFKPIDRSEKSTFTKSERRKINLKSIMSE